MQTILVTGATGTTGSLIVAGLRERGIDVRAFVRDRSRAAALERQGARIVVGDLGDPASLVPAVQGVDTIYLLTWNGPDAAQHRTHVVDVARQHGSPRIVVGGALGPPGRMTAQFDESNRHLQASGLPWTILQPTFFMQNLLGAAATIAQGQLYWDLGEGRLPAIDVRDIAACAVEVLTGEGHEGRTYDLTGPEAISFSDMASVFSAELGRPVQYIPVPTEAAKGALLAMGYTEWVADGVGELMAGFAKNWGADRTTNQVQALTGKPARSFAQFVRDYRGAFLADTTAA